MDIKEGSRFITRDGREVVITHWDASDDVWCWGGRIEGNPAYYAVEWWDKYGRYSKYGQSSLDLIEEVDKPTNRSEPPAEGKVYKIGETYALGSGHAPDVAFQITDVRGQELVGRMLREDGSSHGDSTFYADDGSYTRSEEGRSEKWALGEQLLYVPRFLVKEVAAPPVEDEVNNPAHYTQGGIECIDAIKAQLTPEEFRGYCKGNIAKYVWRERHKQGLTALKKAKWYLDLLIQELENEED